MDFYEQLIEYAKLNSHSVCGGVYTWLYGKYDEITHNCGSLTWHEAAFGPLTWPLEEAAFLKVMKAYPAFLDEISGFLSNYLENDLLFSDLMHYQTAVVKTPFCAEKTLLFRYDWFRYFSAVYENKTPLLTQGEFQIRFHPGAIPEALPEFAEKIVWYGRRGGRNIVSDIEYL